MVGSSSYNHPSVYIMKHGIVFRLHHCQREEKGIQISKVNTVIKHKNQQYAETFILQIKLCHNLLSRCVKNH